MSRSWGASPEEWDAFLSICPGSVWPCVTNPDVPRAGSKIDVRGTPVGKDFAKVPSAIGPDGHAHRFVGWTRVETTPFQHGGWRNNPNLSLGVRADVLRGIDIDIDDQDIADAIDDLISDIIDERLPARMRHSVGRRMLIYRMHTESVRQKQVIVTANGAVEFLFDRQFVVLAGVHHSGARHTWPDGLPATIDDVPEITEAQLDEIILQVREQYGTDETPAGATYHTALAKPRDASDADADEVERVVDLLREKKLFRQFLDGGMISVCCPWQSAHQSTGGQADADPSKTVLFPPGVGGFTNWGFRCMHTEGHGKKTYDEFADAVGIPPREFEVITPPTDHDMTRPKFLGVSKSGEVPALPANIAAAFSWEGLGIKLYYDAFLASLLISTEEGQPVAPLTDTDYFRIQLRLHERVNMPKVSTQALREAVAYVAETNQRDTAIEWANSLVWDGQDRIATFHTDVLGTEDSMYCKEVVRYMFTAMAGRAISPGIKADMVPILVGRQGSRKSTFVSMLAPLDEAYLSVDLSSRDDDLSRILRGKMIVEFEEMRGLSSRDAESIKAWVTRQKESWIPKYKEQGTDYFRRFLIIGTTNNARFLSDPTGGRRWLPMVVCTSRSRIDTEFVKENLTQLWAQAVYTFKQEGIAWQYAETLAANELSRFTKLTPREVATRRWIAKHGIDGFSTTDILVNALGIGLASPSAPSAQVEVERTMIRLGFSMSDDGNWYLDFL